MSDSLGRLVKVTEQDSTGALAQETSYTYDLLDRLTHLNQGNQTRAYKYDGLGRLLYERIPEQGATIWDGTGTMWKVHLDGFQRRSDEDGREGSGDELQL